jgi:hypothetical protein
MQELEIDAVRVALGRAGYLQTLAARHDDHWWTASVRGLLDGGLAALAAAAQDETNEA